eukprot:m.371584 g.371584  ORF g.371584 m.371584 type:complete len:154 (+) comp56139_c0_seq3:445-906(+)
MYAELIWLLFAPVQALANLSIAPQNHELLLSSPVLMSLLETFFSKGRDERSTQHAVALLARLSEFHDILKDHPALEAALKSCASPQYSRTLTPTRKFAQTALDNTYRLRGLPVPERPLEQASPRVATRKPVFFYRLLAFVLIRLLGTNDRYEF